MAKRKNFKRQYKQIFKKELTKIIIKTYWCLKLKDPYKSGGWNVADAKRRDGDKAPKLHGKMLVSQANSPTATIPTDLEPKWTKVFFKVNGHNSGI